MLWYSIVFSELLKKQSLMFYHLSYYTILHNLKNIVSLKTLTLHCQARVCSAGNYISPRKVKLLRLTEQEGANTTHAFLLQFSYTWNSRNFLLKRYKSLIFFKKLFLHEEWNSNQTTVILLEFLQQRISVFMGDF